MHQLRILRKSAPLTLAASVLAAVFASHAWTAVESASRSSVAVSRSSAALAPWRTNAGADHEISAERIAAHIAYLASDELQGRRAGTQGAEKAAQYIASEFKKYGLKPAAPTGFFEPFSFVSRVELGKANALTVRADRTPKALALKDDWMPLAFSSASEVSGDVVFAGYGISAPELKYDNYSGLDVSGKIVLIIRGGPDGDNPHGRFADYTAPGREIEFKTIKARDKGAKGVVFISTTPTFAEDSLSKLPFDLNFLKGGIVAAGISRSSAEAIVKASGSTLDEVTKNLNENPAPPAILGVRMDLRTQVNKITSQSANVVGMIEGSDPELRNQFVVIGAHYDHLGLGGPESLDANPYGKIHHGADDNASGTAALLELARVLSAQRAMLKRTIIFASFSGEEEGLLGSNSYAKNPPAPLASTEAMLNMDMVGRLRDGRLVIGGAATSPAWKPLLQDVNGQASAEAGAANMKFKLSLEDDGYGPSDHQSFYVHDVPVLFFFTGSHEDYHKPSDTADKINNEGARQVAEFVEKIAVEIANRPERIAFSRVKRETRPAGGGFRVYLGTVPNYSEQVDGLKLDGVRPGSPAERAGLRAGDVVIKLGKMGVKNIYDYTYALEELRPGQEVEIVVRRDGQVVTLKITPDKRD